MLLNSVPLNMLVLLIIGKNGLATRDFKKIRCCSKRDRKTLHKITKTGEKAILADFDKTKQLLTYTLARDYFMETVQRNTELLVPPSDCIN
jgi:hypothetical protein